MVARFRWKAEAEKNRDANSKNHHFDVWREFIAQTRPLSATRGKVFFDICILGRKYNFGESEMEVRLHL